MNRLSFPDNSFDTVVDTFGFDYYANPRRVIKEIKRVCRPDGLILILVNGFPEGRLWTSYLRWKQPFDMAQFGRFRLRKWDVILKNFNFSVIQHQRFKNGSIYYYILKNNKN